MTTDTSERGLERLICTALTGSACDPGAGPVQEVPEGFTRIILFAHKALSAMDKDDRVRACYLHACLKYVTRGYLTNASLRERFGVEEKNKAAVSRYIREAVEAHMLRPFEEGAARKLMKYVPFWA